jgi:poly-gamma-glutamate synthesis protein (capsule biosynthesis protein)
LIAVGDIMMSRTVEERQERFGAGYPFAAVSSVLRAADLTLGNLEFALTSRGAPIEKTFVFRGHPRLAEGLATGGFQVLSLANNHALDFGREGLAEALQALRSRGLLTVGAGLTPEAARKPLILDRKGLKIALLTYTAIDPGLPPEAPGQPSLARADPSPSSGQAGPRAVVCGPSSVVHTHQNHRGRVLVQRGRSGSRDQAVSALPR